MDILATVQGHPIESVLIVLAIGILQGMVLARGIRNRFPKLKRHARIVSTTFLLLLSISALTNVIKFAEPEKYEFAIPQNITIKGITDTIISFVGLDGGLVSSFIVFVSITLFLIFRTAQLHVIARYFIFTLSVITFGLFLVARFTDFVPNTLQILLYAMYQVGIAIGAVVVSKRGESKDLLI
ncbi:MAG: putative membrane protein [Cenarchaeum symbiont of Oopsacas minuta]|nr:putative membrane protein [Cenarchaeum symbiont of Oopsacas minuta]